jgi:hypothetical protein
MKLALLTTDTLHHAAFARALGGVFPIGTVLLETRPAAQPFACAHAFEAEREAYERDLFFGGRTASVRDFAPGPDFADVNSPEAREALRRAAPDVVVVFGTGKLKADLIEAYPERLVNLHGGDPEEYRGLDSHLWAIYHRDFGALSTALHFVDRELDTGRIIQQADVPVFRGMGLHQLRAANTEVCIDLCVAALSAFQRLGRFPARRQRRKGRYYGAMPSQLKDLCVTRFAAYAAGLGEGKGSTPSPDGNARAASGTGWRPAPGKETRV